MAQAGTTTRAQDSAIVGDRAAVIAVHTVAEPPTLDGRVDTPAWLAADSITDLRQRDPDEGAPATERTVIRVLRDQVALYVGVRAYDRDPRLIRSSQLRRDADLSSDDNVTILIDSFHDHRSAFLFQTNPNGAMADAQLIGTDDVNDSWNGIWYVATRRDDLGWTAVFRIPFYTLRFKAGTGAAFGFNVRRFIRRKNEEDLWLGWLRTQGLEQLAPGSHGHLIGLGGVSRALGFEVKPYALVNAYQAPHDSLGNPIGGAGVAGKVGVDAKLAVSPTLTADLTINTDFAQVEIDSQVINLTRFPTFFPEKRDFFLESSGIFDFGFNNHAQLFYSRRIGLTDSGAVVPILAGARLYGKVGPWSVGLLDARTGGIDDANNAVVRLRHDLFDRSYIGALVTARTGPGVHGTDLAGGLDAEFPLLIGGQNVVPSAWVAGTRSPDTMGTRVAWRLATDFPNDLFDNFVAVARYDSGFAPPLGFVQRSGAWETYGHFDFMPRPHILGIRQLNFSLPDWDIYANLDGSLTDARDWQTAIIDWRPLGVTLDNSDEGSIDIQRAMDAPTAPFEVFPGVTIPPGRYWWTQLSAAYQTSLGRPISGNGYFSTGTFYNGHSNTGAVGGTWRTGAHLIIGAGFQRTEAWLPAGRFVALNVTGQTAYAFTTHADFQGFIQYDNSLARADFDFRFHWIPVIGDDLYVVWSSGYTTYARALIRFPRPQVISAPLAAGLTIKFVHRFGP